MFDPYLNGIRDLFGGAGNIPLHAPWFDEADEKAVADCVRGTFVSSVGPEIVAFEKDLATYTGAPFAVAVVNGTAALHVALMLAGAGPGTLVITQAFTFIATANTIAYTGARPVFVDIDNDTLGMSPEALLRFLNEQCHVRDRRCMHKSTGQQVSACVPMHTFGFCARIDELAAICNEWHIVLVEDAAEALGSLTNGRHAGTVGPMGTLSFNGNKIITCGGGGAILFQHEDLAKRAKHLTTQAKLPHAWAFSHDELGYNYRMPNLNAALARSQMTKLEHNISVKRDLHDQYRALFTGSPWTVIEAPAGTISNYWLNALLLRDRNERDAFLQAALATGIQARPAWEPAHTQPMFAADLRGDLDITMDMHARLVNIPSSARP